MVDYLDAFGRVCVEPEKLTREQRIEILRRGSGSLQAAADVVHRWIGRALAHSLMTGIPIEVALGINAVPGCKKTASAIVRADMRKSLLLRLSAMAGSDALAVDALRAEHPPEQLAEIVKQLHELKAPCSIAAFTRARRQMLGQDMTTGRLRRT